jgi:hypothetical protein
MDQIESGRQCWSHCDILADAENLGLYGRDLFILVPPTGGASRRWLTQHHARKRHSYLWVFELPRRAWRNNCGAKAPPTNHRETLRLL